MNNYFNEKSKFYYQMYLNKKLVKKVTAIIRHNDTFLAIIKKGKAYTVGGSVDIGESTKDAVKREVLEETGGIVNSIKYLTKEYYSIDWEYEGRTFPNKRVEYYYLCTLENADTNIKGLSGEFDETCQLKWLTLKQLKELNLCQFELNLINKIVAGEKV